MEYSPEEAYRADPELSKMVDYFKAAHETKEERKKRLAKEAAEAKAEQEKKQQEQKQNDYDNGQPSASDTLATALALGALAQLVDSLQNASGNNEESTSQEQNEKSNESNDSNIRKQEYAGTIKKCPNCGAEVPAFTLTCPTCGHELKNVKVNDSLKDFQEGLIKYEGKQERDFVASFPIPNTREDLGNFMLMLASILNSDLQNGADSLRISAFSSKFNEVKSKININFPENDPIKKETEKWEQIINSKFDNWKSLNKKLIKKQQKENVKQEKENIKKQKFKYRHPIAHKVIWFYIWFFIFEIIGLIVYPNYKVKKYTAKLEQTYNEITEFISNEDYTAAELKLPELKYVSPTIMDSNESENKKIWEEKRADLQKLIDEGKRRKRK